MVELGVVFGLVGMVVGTLSIALLFFTHGRALPQFKRASELNVLVIFSFLIGLAVIVAGRVLTLGAYHESVALAFFFIGTALAIHLVRTISV